MRTSDYSQLILGSKKKIRNPQSYAAKRFYDWIRKNRDFKLSNEAIKKVKTRARLRRPYNDRPKISVLKLAPFTCYTYRFTLLDNSCKAPKVCENKKTFLNENCLVNVMFHSVHKTHWIFGLKKSFRKAFEQVVKKSS